MRLHWVRTHGLFGLRVGPIYFNLRDIRSHPLLFSERNGYSGRRLAKVGNWQLWARR